MNEPNIVEAMRLLRDGQDDAGLVLYRRCLKTDSRNVPAGLHIRMLRNAGRDRSADAIRDLALLMGADLGIRRLSPASPPAAIAGEYRELFEAGLINSRMVARYLVALDRSGQRTELARLVDPARLLRQLRLEIADPSNRHDTLAHALQHGVLEREHLACHEEAVQSVRDMHNLKFVQTIQDPAFQTLVAAVREEVSRLIADWKPLDHPVSRWLPQDFQLSMWALTSRGTGFNSRHVHPYGWYTGVYYVTGLPSTAGNGGVLRIGRPADVDADAAGWPDLTIRPEPGLLVLMPSYYTHWTEPLGQPGLRISIPFDVLDRREAEATSPDTD